MVESVCQEAKPAPACTYWSCCGLNPAVQTTYLGGLRLCSGVKDPQLLVLGKQEETRAQLGWAGSLGASLIPRPPGSDGPIP